MSAGMSPMAGPVVLAAGGTGGHLFPAEALARVLRGRGQPVVLVTDSRGKAFGDALADVPVHRIRAATLLPGIVGKARTALELGIGTWQARRLLAQLDPCVVVGFGGYPAFPTVFAANMAGIPTVLHEQNAVLGRANRMLAGKAKVIATSFPDVTGLGRADPSRLARTGNPVRPGILALSGQPYPTPRPDGPLRLLVTGGSQGAAIFSQVVPQAIALLPPAQQARLHIVQQARPEYIQATRVAYERVTVGGLELAPFFADMPERLAACHALVCRAGASTVAELTVAGRPALLVPYAHAMDDHQTANALSVAGTGGAWLLAQGDFTPQALAARLQQWLASPADLSRAAAAARGWALPDAAERLADMVMEVGGLDWWTPRPDTAAPAATPAQVPSPAPDRSADPAAGWSEPNPLAIALARVDRRAVALSREDLSP